MRAINGHIRLVGFIVARLLKMHLEDGLLFGFLLFLGGLASAQKANHGERAKNAVDVRAPNLHIRRDKQQNRFRKVKIYGKAA
jgi:hypothetical protein